MAIGLPPKKYYSFTELARRFQCDVQDLLHFVIERQITASFYLDCARYQEYQINKDEDQDGIHLFASPVIDFGAPDVDTDFYSWLNGFHYLVWMQRKGVAECEFMYVSKSAEILDEGDIIYKINQRLDLQDILKDGVVMADELARFEAADVGLPNESIASIWPWGNHHTEALGHLEAAATRWWRFYDPTDSGTAPVKADVSAWLQKERGLSQKMADSIASILRPDDLRTGPRK